MSFLVDLYVDSPFMIPALFVLVAIILGWVVAKILRLKSLHKLIVIIAFVILSLFVANMVSDKIESESPHIKIVNDLKKERIFSAIIKAHPEVEGDVRDTIKSIIVNNPEDKISDLVNKLSTGITNKYYQEHLLTTPDYAIKKLLNRNLKMLTELEDKPKLCVKYFMGDLSDNVDDLPKEFFDDEANIKADIIESSVKDHTPLEKSADIVTISQIVLDEYLKRNYVKKDLQKISQVVNLVPDEGCRVAIVFSKVLLSMDLSSASLVLKSLISVSGKAK